MEFQNYNMQGSLDMTCIRFHLDFIFSKDLNSKKRDDLVIGTVSQKCVHDEYIIKFQSPSVH